MACARPAPTGRLDLCDAAPTLVALTYSVQVPGVPLSATSWALSANPAGASGGRGPRATALLAGYFLLGVALTESPARALAGIVLIPVFRGG
jgi:hypothetical protein